MMYTTSNINQGILGRPYILSKTILDQPHKILTFKTMTILFSLLFTFTLSHLTLVTATI